MAGMRLCRSPVGIVRLSANEDACTREIGTGPWPELECDTGPGLCRAESHFRCFACRHSGQGIAESLSEALHHPSVHFPFGEFGHSLSHDHIVVSGSAYVVVRDTFLHGFIQVGEVSVELGHIVLEQRLLHCHESILAFDDVACIAQSVVGVINVQFAIAEVMYLETSFCLCHSCNS